MSKGFLTPFGMTNLKSPKEELLDFFVLYNIKNNINNRRKGKSYGG